MFVNFNILNQLGSPAINSNTFANRPAAGQTGRLFVSTDTFEIYRDNGTSWDLIGGPGSSTITGTGTATQVAYFTSSQAIGSSANLFWDNTSGFLGVATATPTARIEAVKTDGIGIYANYTTNAGSGSSATAIWAKNVTNSSGFAAVIEETTPNATAGQYPLLIKHSLSSGTAGVGMGTGVHWQLPDDAGTFKTTQLTIETINAAAATYATRYRFNVQSNGSSTPVAYINATGLGIFTATPGAALDIHSTGIMAQLNSTSATGNTYIAFQRTGSGLWRIGDTYNGGNNFFELHNTVLGTDALEFEAATNKSVFVAQQIYTTGLARGNYFDYNLSVAAGGSFSSPNAITALTATLDLTLAGNATIPSGARSGLDAYNSISFNGAGTLTLTQGTQIRAYSNLTTGWAFNGNTGIGTVTHLAGLRVLFPDNTGNAINVTNNYALLLNDQTANTGTVTYTNRWGVYQEGASDLNYMAANLLLGSTTNNGNKLQVTGNAYISGDLGLGTTTLTGKLNVSSGNAHLNSYFVTGTSAGWDIKTYFTGGNAGSEQFIYFGYPTAETDVFIQRGSNGRLAFGTAATSRMTIDTAGNLGLGVTPAAWRSNEKAIQVGGYTALWNINSVSVLGNNLYTNSSGNPIYINSDYASQYAQVSSEHRWYTAPSGTAGNVISLTQAMTLDANGNLIVGDTLTADNTRVYIKRTSGSSDFATNTTLFLQAGAETTTANLIRFNGALSKALVFGRAINSDSFIWGFTNSTTPVMTLTGNGNLLVGTTTDAGQKLQVNGNIKIDAGTSTNLITGTVQNGVTALISTTDPVNSDRIYNLGFGSSNYVSQGRIEVYATENWSATNRGCEFRIRTTPNAGTTPTNRIIVKNGGQVRFVPLAADPAGAEAGDVYYNSGTNKLRLYDGTNWVDLN